MDKEVVVHVHNGLLLSYKKESFESVLMKWMNQEPIIQNEVSQKEKDKYCILIHIYGKSHGRGGLCHGVAKSRTRLSNFTFTSLSCTGEGNGNPLQCSCLENPRDGTAWWAAISGVTESQTQLKRPSSSSSSMDSKKIVLGSPKMAEE